MSNIYEKLAAIQQAIKVPKDLNNEFAGFKYRSAEGIIERLKPLLNEYKVLVTLSDEVEDHSEQSYIKATALMVDLEDITQKIPVSALAREEKTRPKMSEGQLTGSASSYARKYALNGLLLLDDNKDPDSQNNTKGPSSAITTATEKQIKTIYDTVQRLTGHETKEDMDAWLTKAIGGTPDKLSVKAAGAVITKLFDAEKQRKTEGVKANQDVDTVYEVPDGEINLDNAPY